MPNWCSNSITIQGPTETIKQLWEDAHADMGNNTERGLLDAMFPMPRELQGTVKGSNGDEVNWYDWRVNNWGTKWDIDTQGLEFTDNGDGTASISGWFDSAWAPPIGAYEKFCDDMDNCSLEASYHEPGMDFAGLWSSEDGDEYFESLTEEHPYDDDEFWESPVGRELDDIYNIRELINPDLEEGFC